MPTSPVYDLAAVSAQLNGSTSVAQPERLPRTMTAAEQRAREMQAACLLAGHVKQAEYWERRVAELGFWARGQGQPTPPR